jgi:hypothetical protein
MKNMKKLFFFFKITKTIILQKLHNKLHKMLYKELHKYYTKHENNIRSCIEMNNKEERNDFGVMNQC